MITDYQSGDRVEMRVDEYAQYGAKFPAESRDAMTYIVDSPEAISAYNESGNSPAIPQDAGFGAGGDVSIVVAIVGENGGGALDLTGMNLAGVDRLYPMGDAVSVTLDQASIQMYAPPALGGGSYVVVDDPDAIKADLASGSGVIDGDVSMVRAMGVMELTVAEYNQLTDGRVLDTDYRIVDEAANIQAEISVDGTDAGVLGGALSVESSDVAPTLNLAQMGLLVNLSGDLVPGHIIADTGAAIEAAPNPLILQNAQSIIVTEGQATVSVWEYAVLEQAGNIADTKDFAIVDSASSIDMGAVNFADPASVTATIDDDTNLAWYTNLATNATDLQVNGFNATLSVEQVNGLNIDLGGGSYDVVDAAGPIEGNISAIDDADEVFSADVLTLTVAEHKALDDEDTTLYASYKINDSVENIMAEVQSASVSQAGYDEIISSGLSWVDGG